MHVHFLIFHRSPQPFCKNVVQCSSFSIHTYLHLSGLQEMSIRWAGEVAPLIALANGWSGLSQSTFQCSQDKGPFQCARPLPHSEQTVSTNPARPPDTSSRLSSECT